MSESHKADLLKIIINDNLTQFKSTLCDLNQTINHKSGDNSLHLCSIFNSIKIIKYLLIDCIDQIDVNRRNREEKTALHLSAQYGNEECLKLLLNTNKASIDALKRSDWSPLMLALTKDNLEIVRLLVQNKANLRLRNKDGWNGFHIAVRTGNLNIIKYLLSCDKTIWSTKSNTNRSPLHTAALSGNYSVVEFLLDNCDYACDQRDSCGVTPFMESVRVDKPDISQLFIRKQNINPLVTDVLGRNPLHISSEANAINSIKFLVNQLGFDVNCVTTVGHLSALHLAAKEGHKETIELLLELGSDPSLRDINGRTAYDLAVAVKHNDCALLLK